MGSAIPPRISRVLLSKGKRHGHINSVKIIATPDNWS